MLLPAADERDGAAMMDNIKKLVEINNQFYSGLSRSSLSMGAATSRPGERLEAVAKRADLLMFEAKRALLRRRRARPPRGRRRRLTVTH